MTEVGFPARRASAIGARYEPAVCWMLATLSSTEWFFAVSTFYTEESPAGKPVDTPKTTVRALATSATLRHHKITARKLDADHEHSATAAASIAFKTSAPTLQRSGGSTARV